MCGDREIKNPAVRKYSVLQSIGHGVPKILNIQVFGVFVYRSLNERENDPWDLFDKGLGAPGDDLMSESGVRTF